jgi:hypothetical protein
MPGNVVLPSDWLIQTRPAMEKHSAIDGKPVSNGDVAYFYCKFRLTPRFVGNITVTGNNGPHRRKVFELVRFSMTSRRKGDVALNYAMEQAL